MSRILKASRLSLTFPTTINNPREYFLTASEELPGDEGANEGSLRESAALEAEAILKETEVMVRELLSAAKDQGEQVLQEARREAQGIIAAAEEQRKAWQQEAYHLGEEAGYQEGVKRAKEEHENILLKAKETLAEAIEEKKRMLAASEEEILQLVVALARKVVAFELATNPDSIKNLVQAVLAKVCDSDKVIIKANPADIETIVAAREELMASFGFKDLEIQGESNITQGGCLVETACGNIDGRLERRLEEVEQSLLDVSDSA